MIVWIIISIITFLYLRWLVKVPCLVDDRRLVREGEPGYRNYYDTYIHAYSPIGMKVWMFMLIVLISIVPILNVIGILVGIIGPLIWRAEEDIPWNEVFPKGPGKVASFLNKPL